MSDNTNAYNPYPPPPLSKTCSIIQSVGGIINPSSLINNPNNPQKLPSETHTDPKHTAVMEKISKGRVVSYPSIAELRKSMCDVKEELVGFHGQVAV
jgi:hypothetical protein